MRHSKWLSYDENSGMGTAWQVEPGSERTLTQGQSRAHVQDIVEDNKRLKSVNPSGKGPMGEHVATIPLGVMNDWLHEMLGDGVPMEVAMDMRHPETQRRMAEKLNNSEYRHIRTSEGQF